MPWWQQAFLGGCAVGVVVLLSSIDKTLEGIKNSVDLARFNADRNHETLLNNLYNLSKAKRQAEEDNY